MKNRFFLLLITILLVLNPTPAYSSDTIPADTDYFKLTIEFYTEISPVTTVYKVVWNGKIGYIYNFDKEIIHVSANSVDGVVTEKAIIPKHFVRIDKTFIHQLINLINNQEIYNLSGHYSASNNSAGSDCIYKLTYKKGEKLIKKRFETHPIRFSNIKKPQKKIELLKDFLIDHVKNSYNELTSKRDKQNSKSKNKISVPLIFTIFIIHSFSLIFVV